jgi:fumarylacetoacetate (FAA) hydrolase
MKLASLKGGRDGHLLVVSRDLARATDAGGIAPTLQNALDHWDQVSEKLASLAEALEHDRVDAFAFDPCACAAPLPRAFQWADGSAYVNHVELVRRARGASMPESLWSDPLMYQGGSDTFLGPCDPVPLADADWGADFEGELAVIVDDVAMGVSRTGASAGIRLVMLANDISLRNLIAAELAKGFGFFHAKPSTAFSPVAVTQDELGAAWDGGKLHLPLQVHLNGTLIGRANAGRDMTFDFPDLIAHAARTRRLSAGSIIGSGTVSNRGSDGGPGLPVERGGAGYSCLAEIRTIETIETGKPHTPFLQPGDKIRIEIIGVDGLSIFGAIEQTVRVCG